MQTLVPASFFHVRDKYLSSFVYEDEELEQSPAHLYIYLFSKSYRTGQCLVSQERLAKVCKCCVRSVQAYIKVLVELQYIEVIRDELHGRGVNAYRLLLSPRLQKLLAAIAAEEEIFSSYHTQNLQEGRANIAPCNKSYKSIYISPLPPKKSNPEQSRKSKPTGMGESSFCQQAEKPCSPHTAPSEQQAQTARTLVDFERLWAVWPVKKSKLAAQKVFCSLVRLGKLPPVNELLALVEKFKSEDKHWKNGCCPMLLNWLRGECWHDEPFHGQNSNGPNSMQPAQQHVPARQELSPVKPDLSAEERKQVDEFSGVAALLKKIWPHESGKIRGTLVQARLRGFSLSSIAEKAKAVSASVPFDAWLQEEVWA